MSNKAKLFVHRIKNIPSFSQKREAGDRRGYSAPSNLVFFIWRSLCKFNLIKNYSFSKEKTQAYEFFIHRHCVERRAHLFFFALIIAYIDENIPSYFVEYSNHLSFSTSVTIKFCTSTVNSFLHL